jgi:ankyrin repeat protein
MTIWKLTPVQLAIDKKNIRMLNLLIDRGALTYTEGDFKNDPIAMAIDRGYPFLATVLRATDANVLRKDSDGAGFLEYAITNSKDQRTVNALIRAGLNVNEPTDKYGTPLHLAADRGNEGAVRTLLAHGADVNALDKSGRTPLDVAKGSVDQIISVFGGRRGREFK